MFTLEPREYAKVSASLNSVPFNTLFAQAVVDGYMPGSVHVDDPKKPGACYVSHIYGMSLLFGETADEHFYARLLDHLVNSRGRRHADEWLQVSPRGWSDRIASLLGPRLQAKGSAAKVPAAEGSASPPHLAGRDKVVENTRLNFAFDPDLYARVALPSREARDEIRRTDGVIFRTLEGAVAPKNFWRDENLFLRDGVGFSLIRNGETASTAFSAFLKGSQLEIGIETRETHRGQGLALLTTAALIDYCLENGLEPVWSCREENAGSVRLARKLGFVPTLRVPYYRLVV